MAKKVVLLTGAAGFIGSHVAEQLLARGDMVVGIDNFDSYYDPSQKRSNAALLSQYPHFQLVEGDIRDQALMDRLFSLHRFSAIAHLAALAGVRASVDSPALYFDVNLTATLGLLELARLRGRPNFVFASTSSVYGRTQRIPFDEEDAADRPLAPYPASKRSVELLGHSYHHTHGLDFTALRFFTVYGPRNRPDMMAHLALCASTQGKTLTLYNGGEMYRDWTFISDIADGVVRAIDRRLGYEIINLGRGKPILLKDFVTKLATLSGGSPTYRSRPIPDADVVSTFARIDKARRLLGYEPLVDVEEGILRLYDWFRASVLHAQG